MIDKFKQFKVESDLDDSAQFIEIVEKICILYFNVTIILNICQTIKI